MIIVVAEPALAFTPIFRFVWVCARAYLYIRENSRFTAPARDSACRAITRSETNAKKMEKYKLHA